jgi:F0F1-type ATP synthase assembly protein I
MDNDNKPKKQSLLNSEYLQVFAKVSVWIITPVIFSLIIGKFLDNKFHTTPWILGVSLALSFTVSMIAIVKIAKENMDRVDKDIKNNEPK